MLVAGVDVTIADDETVATGSGLKLALYQADVATLTLPPLPALGATSAPFTAQRPCSAEDQGFVRTGRVAMLRDVARRANAYGGAIVPFIQDNARTVVSLESLGRTPDPNNPNVAILPPAEAVRLRIE